MSFAVLVVLLLFNSFGLSWDEACMGQCGHCSVLFPRDRSWFVQYPTLLIEWLFHLCLRFYIMLSSNLNLGRLQRHYHMDACVWPHFCIALQLVFFSFFLLEISRSRCVTCVWMHIFRQSGMGSKMSKCRCQSNFILQSNTFKVSVVNSSTWRGGTNSNTECLARRNMHARPWQCSLFGCTYAHYRIC
jgi:hypothetical protein